jgi:hypothetical protein
MNLFNLLPTAPQETRNLYYEARVTEFSRIGTADTPYIESFEDMMARAQKGSESSGVERGASPGAELADGTDYIEDNTEKSGHTDDQRAPAEKPPVARDRAGPDKPHIETEEPGEKKLIDEEMFVGGPSLGMVPFYPAPNADDNQVAVEDIPDAVVTESMETEGITATNMAAPDVKADPAFSLEDGITFTDTYPLFENKPNVRGTGFNVPVDPSFDAAPTSGLVQDAGIILANLTGEDTTPDAAKQTRDTKGGPKGDVSEDSEVPEPFQALPDLFDSGPQLVLLVNNAENTENGAKPENTESKKKTDSRKLNVEVVDMRSDSGANVRDSAFTDETKTAAIPVKDLLVDLKGAALGSLGDSCQTPAGLDQLNTTNSAAQLERFLSRELHNGLNGDIVRQAAVMLRDGGEGLIRLQLHPESLGNVRIKLSMSGNKVEGIITVESPEAMNAFERELESLEMAFRDSGFEGASLNMQMSGGKTGGGLFDGVQAGVFSRIIAASSYESSAVTAGGETGSIYDHGGLSILA